MAPLTAAPTIRGGSILVAYALFVLVGLSSGVNGVLLLEQMDDYGIGRATIGITFFTFAAGFVLAGATTGPLVHRWGTRLSLLAGGAVFIASGLVIGTRPSFVLLLGVQVVAGYGSGLMESVLNAYLAALPRSTTLLNRLHAFFGVGALLGPVAATGMLQFTTWPIVILALTLVSVPLLAAVWLTYPDQHADPIAAARATAGSDTGKEADDGAAAGGPRRGMVAAVLRQPAVLLAATMLSVYVGLEIGLGNWGYGFLVDARSASAFVASWTISAYWFGLTAGRFVLSPIATRLRLTKIGLGYVCLVGLTAATALAWVAPTPVVAAIGFVLVGFFLGPVFPTTMAVAPDLTTARLAPTAIGVMNAGSVVGGAGLPWLAGLLGQSIGPSTLLPFSLLLAVMLLVVWWRMSAHMDPTVAAFRVPATVP